MINILNAVAVTLLVAVLSVFPATLVAQYVPGFLNPVLKPIAVAAWLSALVSWYVARHVMQNQLRDTQVQENRKSNSRNVGIAMAFLAMAIGVAVALHFFGERLLAETLSAVTP